MSDTEMRNAPSGWWSLTTLWNGLKWTAVGCGSYLMMLTAPGHLYADFDMAALPAVPQLFAESSDDLILQARVNGKSDSQSPAPGDLVVGDDTEQLQTLTQDDEEGPARTAEIDLAIQRFHAEARRVAPDTHLYRQPPTEKLLNSFEDIQNSLQAFYAQGSPEEKATGEAYKALARAVFNTVLPRELLRPTPPVAAMHVTGRHVINIFECLNGFLFAPIGGSSEPVSAEEVTSAASRLSRIIYGLKVQLEPPGDAVSPNPYYDEIAQKIQECFEREDLGHVGEPLDRGAWDLSNATLSAVGRPWETWKTQTPQAPYSEARPFWHPLAILEGPGESKPRPYYYAAMFANDSPTRPITRAVTADNQPTLEVVKGTKPGKVQNGAGNSREREHIQPSISVAKTETANQNRTKVPESFRMEPPKEPDQTLPSLLPAGALARLSPTPVASQTPGVQPSVLGTMGMSLGHPTGYQQSSKANSPSSSPGSSRRTIALLKTASQQSASVHPKRKTSPPRKGVRSYSGSSSPSPGSSPATSPVLRRPRSTTGTVRQTGTNLHRRSSSPSPTRHIPGTGQ